MSTPEPESPPSCWVLTEGMVGMDVQARGLAEALGLDPRVMRVALRRPWRWLPPLLVPNPLQFVAAESRPAGPPWPGVLISCGRKSVAPAMTMKRLAGAATFAIHIQDPGVTPARFDLVVAPSHDGLKGLNVIETLGSLGRVTPERLAEAKARFLGRFGHLPQPRVAVLIGGASRAFELTEEIARRLVRDLVSLARRHGAGLMVTGSRRTGPGIMELVREGLRHVPAEIWNGKGDNPYLGMLALSDHVIVTGESVNLVSEAAATGRPVHVVPLKGGSARFDRFHRAMERAGITRPFDGRLDRWSYEPLQETRRVAEDIGRRWRARRAGLPG